MSSNADSCGNIEVVSDPEPVTESNFDSSQVYTDSCGLSATQRQPGDLVAAEPHIVNDNDTAADVTVGVLVDGVQKTSSRTDVPANSDLSIGIQFYVPDSLGTYAIGVFVSEAVEAAAPVAAPATADEPATSTSAAPQGAAMTDGGTDGGCGSCGSREAYLGNRAPYVADSAPGGPVCRAFASFAMVTDRQR